MPYTGNKPSAVPLTSADIADSIITSAKIVDGTIVNADINASAAIASTKLSGSFGKVLQVVSTTKTDYLAISATTTFTDITGLSVSITPSSVSNKILILGNVACGGNGGGRLAFRLVKDSTAISIGDTAGSRPRATVGTTSGLSANDQINASFNFLDSPATTSSTTYKVQYIAEVVGAINGSQGNLDANSVGNSRTVSTITVMEIAI